MSEELKACSECLQENPEYIKHKPIIKWRFKIFCPNCGLTISAYEKEIVIKKWNARA